MRNYIIKSCMALACLALVAMPLTAQKGKGGGGGGGSTGGSGCAVVATPMLSTTTAAPGINVGIYSRVGNCSTGKATYTVTVSSLSSCSAETIISSSAISFRAGEYKLTSVSYPLAPDTCTGPMVVTMSVYSGGTLLASDSSILTVQ
jgi:hypothetical protein